MAKTAIEKLKTAIETAISLKDSAVVGIEEGQYPQEYVDSFSVAIESTKQAASNENAELPQLELALEAIGAALKMFKGSVVKAVKEPDKTVKTQEKANQTSVSLKGVILKGTDSEKQGVHTIFAYGASVTFRDGKADVNDELAEKLITDGYAKEGKSEDGE